MRVGFLVVSKAREPAGINAKCGIIVYALLLRKVFVDFFLKVCDNLKQQKMITKYTFVFHHRWIALGAVGKGVESMSKRTNDKNRKQAKTRAREAAQREVRIQKSKVVPSRPTSTRPASKTLVTAFDEMLAGLGEPSDHYFASVSSMNDGSQGMFVGIGDCEAEVGDLIHEWLWKMRLSGDEPLVIRGNHGTAVGYSFRTQTEQGSFVNDFGLYVEPDSTIELVPQALAVSMSWNRDFMRSYDLEERIRRAQVGMMLALMEAYGLRFTSQGVQ